MNKLIPTSLLVLATACAQQSDSLTFETDAPELGKADHNGLALEVLQFADVGERRFEGGLSIITSAENWQAEFGTAAPADIDFDREWAVFFGIGGRATGGYSASVESIDFYPSWAGVVVNTLDISPGLDCRVTQAPTTPHVVAKFDIPFPRPEWYAVSGKSESPRCGPTTEERLAQLADSFATFTELSVDAGQSYTYTTELHSFTGFSARTTLVVEDNVVTERLYKAQHESGGDAIQYHEVGDEVGTHDEGADPLLVQKLYDRCENEVLTKDPETHFINLGFHPSGVLRYCEAADRLCNDDCSRGVNIATIEFAQ